MLKKSILFLLLLCFQMRGYSQNTDTLRELCNYHLDPINFHDSLFEYKIYEKSLMFVNCGEKLSLEQVKKSSEFKTFSQTNLPNAFQAANCQTWALFKIYNPYVENKNILLGGNIQFNQYYTMNSNGKWVKHEIRKKYINFKNIKINGHNRSILTLPPQQYTYVLYEQSKLIYDKNNALPLLNNADHYIERYSYKMNTVNIIFAIATISSFILMVITGIYYILFKRKELLYYFFYLISICFVAYRNFEWQYLFAPNTLGYLPWYVTKVFHTSAYFVTYAYFIYYFLNIQDKIIKWLINGVKILIITACLLEAFFLLFYPSYSYTLYYILRITVPIVGLAYIASIMRSPHPYAKYILYGSIILIISELISNFYLPPISSILPTVGTLIEVLIFSTVLGISTFQLYKKHLIEANEAKLTVLNKNEEISLMRKNFAQDLHDELGSTVTRLNLQVFHEQHKTKREDGYLKDIQRNLEILSVQIKEMVWLFNDHKSNMKELITDIRLICNEYTNNTNLTLNFDLPNKVDEIDIPLEVKRNILAIVKEAMTNIIKHSDAHQVDIICKVTEKEFILQINDDGNNEVLLQKENFGMGLKNMKNRAKKMGGLFSHEISANGCFIKFMLPTHQ